MTEHQVFHDDAGFDDGRVAIPEQRKFLDWPQRFQRCPAFSIFDHSIAERGRILVQRNQYLPTIGGKGVSVKE